MLTVIGFLNDVTEALCCPVSGCVCTVLCTAVIATITDVTTDIFECLKASNI